MTYLIQTLWRLMKAILLLAIWFGLSLLMQNGCWNKTYYQNNEIPPSSSRVLIFGEQGFRQPETWENAQKLPPNQWVKAEPHFIEFFGEDFFRATPNGTWLWHNEAALAYTETEYRIENNRLIPISFRKFTFVDAFLAMFGAVVLMKLGKYAFRCWQYRHSPEQLKTYHREIAHSALMIGGLLVVGVAWYWLLA